MKTTLHVSLLSLSRVAQTRVQSARHRLSLDAQIIPTTSYMPSSRAEPSSLPATEPFDEALDRKIWGIHSGQIQHESENAKRRKELPAKMKDVAEELESARIKAEWVGGEVIAERESEFLLLLWIVTRAFHIKNLSSCQGLRAYDNAIVMFGVRRSTYSLHSAVKEGEIPPPPRHQETKEVFSTVAANLLELNNVSSARICVYAIDGHVS